MSEIDVLVVGGGISGLSIAQRLAIAGRSVEVWEKELHPGGKIGSDCRDGYLTEQAAAMVLNFRPEVTRFIAESGLDSCKKPRADTSHRYVVNNGKLEELPMKLGPLLASDVWSAHGKARMMMEPFVRKGGSENETVSQFISRRLGREVLEKTIAPYVAGLLASDADLANARSVLPRLVALEKRYGSIAMGVFVHRVLKRKTATETEAFSFRDGMATPVSLLASSDGVSFRGGHAVTEIAKSGNRWQAVASTAAGERQVKARQLVISTPADTAATLLSGQSAELGRLLRGVEYASLSVVHTGFDRSAVRHPLDGNGFLTQGDNGTALTGCMWMSSLFADRAPPGKALLCNYLGGARHPEAVKWDDTQLLSETMRSLRPLLGINADPEFVHINRHKNGLPLYHGDYHNRMQHLEQLLTRLPGLHVEANFRGGISVRDRIVCAMGAADRIHRQLHLSSSKTFALPRLTLEPQMP